MVLRYTRYGRQVYAVGGNPEAARLSGLNVRRVTLSVYVIMGFFAGLGAFVLAARLNSAEAVAGTGYELTVIASVVIGGTSLFGGVGSIFTETCTVHPSSPGPLVAWRDDVVPGLAELAERLHALDTCVFAQLWHGGIQAFPRDGSPAWAPSRIADPIHGRVAQPMTQAMIDEVVEAFAAAAVRAERAGLDGVEVHGAHSYLVHSFLSPLTNTRDDAYGADRLRFAREVLTAIRAATGPSFAVGIRIVGSEGVDGGIDPTTIKQAWMAGADSFVAGQAVFGQADPAAAIRALRRACAVEA